LKKKAFILSLWVLAVFVGFPASGQNFKTDLELLNQPLPVDSQYLHRNVKFGFTQSNNVLLKYNPVNLAFASLMYVYQKGISPQIMGGCLYKPSCSNYSKNLIKDFGLLKGIPCTADRLMRCNRMAASDFWPIQVDEHDHRVHETTSFYIFTPKK
jgi:uncharacterized protein